MNKQLILCLLCLLCLTFVFGHEGHKHTENNTIKQESVTPLSDLQTVMHFEGTPFNWMKWIGSFHFFFIHFPIALITMTAMSELLFFWFQRPIFDYTSRFMLIAAAVFSVPTALLGLTYSYTTSYSGLLVDFIWWHMWLGIATAVFAILVALIMENLGRSKLYYISLVILFLLVNITGYIGGIITWNII